MEVEEKTAAAVSSIILAVLLFVTADDVQAADDSADRAKISHGS
jgi:hypothetical protein